MNSRFNLGSFCLVILALTLAACSGPAPTATVAPTPTSITPPTTPPPPATVAPPTDAPASATNTPVALATPLTSSSPARRLLIPALALDVPVIEVGWHVVTDANGARTTEWDIAENAAGHHINSAAPGTAGNVVISGHNNIKGKVFEAISLDVDRPTPRLTPGSDIELQRADGRRLIYRVQRVDLTPETGAPLEQRLANARYLEQTPDATLTLITCWPSFGNTHRVIVIAKLAQVF